jgi:hypothetical protein
VEADRESIKNFVAFKNSVEYKMHSKREISKANLDKNTHRRTANAKYMSLYEPKRRTLTNKQMRRM